VTFALEGCVSLSRLAPPFGLSQSQHDTIVDCGRKAPRLKKQMIELPSASGQLDNCIGRADPVDWLDAALWDQCTRGGVVPFPRPYLQTRQRLEGVVYGEGKMLPPPFLSAYCPGERQYAAAFARSGERAGEWGRGMGNPVKSHIPISGMWLDRKRHLTLSFSRPKVTSSCGPAHPDGRMFL
jgi:hypothetical protein